MKHIYTFYKGFMYDNADVNGIYTSFAEAKAAVHAYLSHFGIQGPYKWEREGEFNWKLVDPVDEYNIYLIHKRKLNERWWES